MTARIDRHRSLRILLLCAAFLVLAAVPGWAQEAVLSGQVTDPEEEPIPGAMVVVTNEETGLERHAYTNARGRYRLPGLPVGLYTARVELEGFTPAESRHVRLNIGSEVVLNFRLQLADFEEELVVTGQAPLVDTRSTDVGGAVSQEQIEKLPMKSRQWIDLATLLPQTGQDAIRAVFYNSVNMGAGINFYSNGFYVDGVSNNWQQQGEPRQDFPQDGIEEFRVRTSNAPAQFGFAQGGYLTAVTKSGTNQFHGSLYEYFRTKALNSTTIFQDEKPDYKRHQFGGSFGGPIVEDVAHFFGSFEYTDETQFFTVNTGGAFPEQEGTFERPYYNYMLLGRVDHVINESHRWFFRYARQDNEREFVGAGGTNARSASFTFAAPRDSGVFGHTWVIDNDTFNDFRVQVAKATYIGWPSVPGLRWTDAGEFPQERIDSIPTIIHRPSVNIGNQSSFLGPERHFQIRNDFSHYFGDHDLRIGVDLTWVLWQPDNVGISPEFFFATDRPFDPDDPTTFPFLFQQRLLPRFNDFPSTEHSIYVNDTWVVSNEVTLNLGMRYDWQTEVWNENLLEHEFPAIVVAGQTLREAGRPDPALFPFYDASTRGDWNNFGPRVGVNWDPGADGRQSVRVSYGLFYNRFRGNGEPRAERNPEDLLVVIRNPSFPDPYEGRDPFEVASALANRTILSNEARTPYTHQFAVGYSREIADQMSISVDATIAEGGNQHTAIDFNYPESPQALAAGVRPHPQFGRVQMGLTDGDLEYRSLAVRLDRRFADGWQFMGSYTLASAKNDAEGLPADHFDRRAEFGYADADRRHRLTLSGMVELPWGIFGSGIMRYMSSLPVNVTAGRDLNGDGIGNDRPPGVTRNQGCRELNLAAVNDYRAANGLGAVGEFECPSYLTFDFVAMKRVPLGTVADLELMFQVFNAFNRSNLRPPVGNALSALFGQSVAAADPRQMELVGRITF